MKTAVIDLDSIAFAAGSDIRLLDESGAPLKGEDGKSVFRPKTQEELITDTDKILDDILTSCGADSYIAYIKSYSGIPSFRYSVNPDYKANRDKVTPEWWPTVKKRLIDKWQAIPVADYEVDDYVNVTRLNVPDSFIVAIDRDLLDLEGTHYNWKKKEWITVEPFQAQYWFWRDMITGQPGDNIKGIPKKGKVFVEKLFDLRDPSQFRSLVLEEYCKHFGERVGIGQFAMNYGCLKLLDNIDDLATGFDIFLKPFIIPTPVPYVKEVADISI